MRLFDCFDDLNFFFEQIVHQIGEVDPFALGIRGKIILHPLVDADGKFKNCILPIKFTALTFAEVALFFRRITFSV